MLVFAFGSLMSPASLRTTSQAAHIHGRDRLRGYQRKCNAVHKDFPDAAMNIVPNAAFSVSGVVVEFPQSDIPALYKRETGYEACDVTAALEQDYTSPVFAFMAPDALVTETDYVRRSYLDTCLDGVPDEEREQWLLETVVECQIRDDL